MRDTQPQLLQVARLGAAASFRPDSPRSRTDKSQRSSSQHWNQYPPRTAETRRWRPSHLDCHQQQQQQPQRYPKAAQRDVCTALRTPLNRKQVTFYGVPDSSGIGGGGGGGAAQVTGPAREHRRRQRQRQQAAEAEAEATAAKLGGSLARCLSAALISMQAMAARFAVIVQFDPRPAPRLVAVRRTRLGSDTTAREQEQAARLPSSTTHPGPGQDRAAHAHQRQHTLVRRAPKPATGEVATNRHSRTSRRRYTLIKMHDGANLSRPATRFCCCRGQSAAA
ncbi:hypothetical protein MY5147_004803 [Beauveria neobassiana]